MTKRDVIKLVLDKKRPPYAPWNIGLTKEAREKLQQHFGQSDPSAPLGTSLEDVLQNHFLFPNPLDPRFFDDIPERIEKSGDRFRVFQIGFSLWERAWTMRGWENLMMDTSLLQRMTLRGTCPWKTCWLSSK